MKKIHPLWKIQIFSPPVLIPTSLTIFTFPKKSRFGPKQFIEKTQQKPYKIYGSCVCLQLNKFCLHGGRALKLIFWCRVTHSHASQHTWTSENKFYDSAPRWAAARWSSHLMRMAPNKQLEHYIQFAKRPPPRRQHERAREEKMRRYANTESALKILFVGIKFYDLHIHNITGCLIYGMWLC